MKEKSMLRNSIYMYKKIWKYSKLRTFFMLLQVMVAGVNTYVDVMFYKLMIDGITDHKPLSYVIIILGIRTLTLFIYQSVLAINAEVAYPTTQLKITRGLTMELYEKVKSIDITSVDDAEFYNKYSRAFNEIELRSQVLMYTIAYLLQTIGEITIVGITLVNMNPVILLIAVLGAVASTLANIRKAKLTYDYDKKRTKIRRAYDYVRRIFYLPQYAKDIRTTQVNRILYNRYEKAIVEDRNMIRKSGSKIASVKILAEMIFFFLGTGATSLCLLLKVYKGVIGVGDFVTGSYAVQNLTKNLLCFANILPEFAEHSMFINNFREVMEHESKIEVDEDATDINTNESHQLDLKNVTYRYPNVTEDTIKNVNLSIKRGEKIGLVGENGAGKSTLLKLLMRLYEPDSGEIQIDSHPYRKVTKESLMKSFSIVEQDFQHYAFTIKEDISFEVNEISSEKKIKEALEKVDLLDAIENLPYGLDSCLTNEFDDEGINLSGGQLQRLAIARMIYQDSGILIMDEPSSSLDPVSEAKMFELIYHLAEGKTLILVSHRLSGVKDMDRIVFMEHGEVTEIGTHQELMKQSGKYAEMFKIQAERYGED